MEAMTSGNKLHRACMLAKCLHSLSKWEQGVLDELDLT